MQLKNVREWLEDKPWHLGLLSVFLVLERESIYSASASIYNGSVPPGFTASEFERWKKLYSSPKQMMRGSLGFMEFSGLEGFQYNKFIASLFAAVNAYIARRDTTGFERIQLPNVPPEELQAALRTHLFEKLEAVAFEHARRVGDGADANSPTPADVPVEVGFFFRVWTMCWLVHFEPLVPLFRRARNGDVDALEKLVLLDRNVLQVPRIAKVWARLNEDNESPDFERIHRAMAKQPRLVKYDAYDAKADIAGLIAKMGDALGHPLTASQIGELFDALARDLAPPGQNVHRDPDISRKSPQWRMAVKRKKAKWLESPLFSDEYKSRANAERKM